tara:strand:+ start:2027 stop:3268 length:1242 start_codon:yes stop_codon:yes gene_type:complete
MSMLSSVAFAEAPFSSEGFSPDAKVILQGQSLTVTLSNAYSVQKTHFVNGFNLSLTQGTVTPQVVPQEANFNTTVTLNDPTVLADGTIHLPANSLGMTVSLGATTGYEVIASETGFAIPVALNFSQANIFLNADPTITGQVITSAVGQVATGPGVTGFNLNTAVLKDNGEKTFAVTVVQDGSYNNVFVIDGVQKPALSLVTGTKYIFDQSDGTNANHPLRIAANGTLDNTNVTVVGTPGQAGARVEYIAPVNEVRNISYFCTVHGAGMGNTISITGTQINLSPVAAVSGLSMTSSVNSVIPRWIANVTGQQANLSVNNVNLGYAVNATGNLITSVTDGLFAFTFSDVNDTTTATISGTAISTTGSGGASWSEVSETGAGTIQSTVVPITGGGVISSTPISTTGAGIIDDREVA